MISMVVPTRNRAHTLRLVAPSYFEQPSVSELIFVDDCGDDDTAAVLAEIAARYPEKTLRVIRNAERLGASQSRNVGVKHCGNEYVLFCDDDEYLESNYAETCLRKLQERNAGAVSGRRVYMYEGETSMQALRRFGNGITRMKPFRPLVCEFVNGARFSGDLCLPLTNAIILTRRELVEQYPFDGYYARGNGYREESDYQMNLFVNGYDIYVTNECHSIHLPMTLVRSGGQRTAVTKRIYWSIHYTRYFFGKYYERYARRQGLRVPRHVALLTFTLFELYRQLLRPSLHRIATRIIGLNQQVIRATAAS